MYRVASLPRSEGASRLALPAFTLALGTSAFLLFVMQPLFAKMALPLLGGSPGVWSVGTVVFQSLLLAGYAYAHWLAGLPTKRAALTHLAVMAIAAASLPIAIGAGWRQPPADTEALWLTGLFLASIGLPFLAVAANGPLLQAWFVRSGSAGSQDPYFLYAASNLGSCAALAAYPLLIEPFLPLSVQSRAWTFGFFGLSLLVALCATLAGDGLRLPRARLRTTAPTWSARSGWIAVSAVSSGLIVAVTAHLSTDVAAVPLLWVMPLGLYLLSYALAFRPEPVLQPRTLAFLQAGGTALVIAGLGAQSALLLAVALHLGLFFVVALICHRTLYERRPSADHLTDYYLCLAAGGALGGLFAGLVAPLLFPTVLEYPILLAAAFLCRPVPRSKLSSHAAGVAALWCLGVLAAGYAALVMGASPLTTRRVLVVVFAGAVIICWRSPVRTAVAAVAMGFSALLFQPPAGGGETIRSFFGVHRIITSEDGRFRLLVHGTTIHGALRLLEDDGRPATGRPEPTTYYTQDGPIAAAIRSVREGRGGRLGAVSLVGLGAGSMACHAPWNERWSFYEIDAEVARIARDPAKFRFLGECAPDIPVILGDARLTLARSPLGQDLILLDAFSSDSIPVHLLTREAVALYLSKLGPQGAIVVHVSNRHLDLTRILARVGAEHGLVTYIRADQPHEPVERRMRSAALVIAMARRPQDLGPLAQPGSGWTRLEADMGRRPWTDDYSNVVEALLDKYRP